MLVSLQPAARLLCKSVRCLHGLIDSEAYQGLASFEVQYTRLL